MQKLIRFLLLLLFSLSLNLNAIAQVLKIFLEAHPEIQSMKPLSGNTPFKEVYEIMIKQPLVDSDTSKGYFLQRVFVSCLDTALPTVVVTDGYGSDYAARAANREELSRILNTNQIVVEHRYFSKSIPNPLNWEYLTVSNAAGDHHRVIMLFKQLFKHKWVSTGISKGGQTALYHRCFYPDDVDVTVPYVAPLNTALEDGRHEPYINNIATKEDRKAIRDFQLEVLKRRTSLFPMFQKFVNAKKYTFRIPHQQVYDYCVLEYSFAFWQWGTPISSIPDTAAKDEVIFAHFIDVASPDYFSLEGIKPIEAFMVQAAKEEGYYGYETEPFKQDLVIQSSKDYFQSVFLGPDLKFEYNSSTNDRVRDFLKTQDVNMIFIYGEYDPWSATAVQFSGKKNMFKFVKPGGSHATRILSLPKHQRKFVIRRLKSWTKD
jgi:hypothetical protein